MAGAGGKPFTAGAGGWPELNSGGWSTAGAGQQPRPALEIRLKKMTPWESEIMVCFSTDMLMMLMLLSYMTCLFYESALLKVAVVQTHIFILLFL